VVVEMVKVPRNQEVLVDPEGLPGVYMARVVTTMENCDSSVNVGGFTPVCGQCNKSPLVESVFSPRFVANGDGCPAGSPTGVGGFLKVGSGECLPELPEGGRSVATIRHRDDLQAENSSLPVENGNGNQVDTKHKITARKFEKKIQGHKSNEITKLQNQGKDINYCNKKKVQVLGYVPIQIVNLPLGEIEIVKNSYVRVASPIETNDAGDCGKNVANIVVRTHKDVKDEFRNYVREKLKHLDAKDRSILEPVMQQYQQLFYGLGSEELGCTSRVEHSIDTGNARPIKRNPYRTPYALKPVVDEHINDMLKRNIIEPSMSPWSSSIVLVQKKSKDGSVKYRFCVDYRALNAVTKPDA
jgi:hypothetical protein